MYNRNVNTCLYGIVFTVLKNENIFINLNEVSMTSLNVNRTAFWCSDILNCNGDIDFCMTTMWFNFYKGEDLV